MIDDLTPNLMKANLRVYDSTTQPLNFDLVLRIAKLLGRTFEPLEEERKTFSAGYGLCVLIGTVPFCSGRHCDWSHSR